MWPTPSQTRSGPQELTLRVLPGGGPANAAVAHARLGTPTPLRARLSHDVFGTLFTYADSAADWQWSADPAVAAACSIAAPLSATSTH